MCSVFIQYDCYYWQNEINPFTYFLLLIEIICNQDEVALEITGANEYTNPEGELVSLTYVANELGYQPQVLII